MRVEHRERNVVVADVRDKNSRKEISVMPGARTLEPRIDWVWAGDPRERLD